MRSHILSALLVATSLVAAPAFAQQPSSNPADVKAGTYVVEPTHAKVVFAISHLGFSTYYGAFPKLDGTLVLDPADPAKSKVDIVIDVTAVDTSDPKLDAHLKAADFFDAEKFPTATFKSTKVERTGENTARITGDLTLKDVTKPVVLDATFNQAGVNPLSKVYSIGFDAETTINRSEWGITTYVPAVGDEVKLRIGTEFQLKQ
ncbi:YceI family protein [Indioceanicola profundi]|uniref:YceI family protein n=1 Tax=Indioceanicola profundi TaxID=2220096 RepID=UPI000E6AA9A5|nr:YceI family protein [Indioceanicola profundi]